jgi:hypothetical protein
LLEFESARRWDFILFWPRPLFSCARRNSFRFGFEPGHEGYSYLCPVPSSFGLSHISPLSNCLPSTDSVLQCLAPIILPYTVSHRNDCAQNEAARISIRYPVYHAFDSGCGNESLVCLFFQAFEFIFDFLHRWEV